MIERTNKTTVLFEQQTCSSQYLNIKLFASTSNMYTDRHGDSTQQQKKRRQQYHRGAATLITYKRRIQDIHNVIKNTFEKSITHKRNL